MAGSASQIYRALGVNFVIGASKAVAAYFTHSGAMLAEAIHSFSDCVNQVLLLVGLRQGARPPDAAHPFGYGRNVYFWSFMVALLLFTGGGVFSIYEGLHKIGHPEAMEHVSVGMAILFVSLVLEAWSTWGNIVELRARAKGAPFFHFLRDTKDSDLVVIFGENAAATLGLFFALVALCAAWATGDSRWDGAGGIAIGLVLVGVAVFLAKEVKSLLVGESADPSITHAAEAIALAHPRIQNLVKVMTVQQGPGEVVVACKVHLEPSLTVAEVYAAINEFETSLRAQCPEVKWCFTEPGDRRDEAR